jgi:hypothetical protein
MTLRAIPLPTLADEVAGDHAPLQGAEAIPTHAARELPAAPRQVQDTGLSPLLLSDLLLKVMHQHRLQHLRDLSQHLKLSATLLEELFVPLRREMLVDVRLRGALDGDVLYELTQAGRECAQDALSRSLYSGAAPVPLGAYAARVQAQSVTSMRITKPRFEQLLGGLTIEPALRDQLGAAMNSRGAVMLFGPPGAGKTYLCEQLARLLSGPVAVPHAVEVGGEIIRVYDPLVHRPARAHESAVVAIDNRDRADARWVLCERPVVVTGGELTLEMLDLVFDPRAGFYHAPPHFKANNGFFLIDDLGRQVVTPRQLLNRWLLPMEQHHDYLMLRNGAKFRIPFDTRLFFSTNLRPAEIADEAFLRRIGTKIGIGPVGVDVYRELMRGACEAQQLAFDEHAFEHLVEQCHARAGQPLMACYPRDLVNQIVDRATYLGVPPRLEPFTINWAWHNYFAPETAS